MINLLVEEVYEQMPQICSKHNDDLQVVEHPVVIFSAYYGSVISSPGNLKVTLP